MKSELETSGVEYAQLQQYATRKRYDRGEWLQFKSVLNEVRCKRSYTGDKAIKPQGSD